MEPRAQRLGLARTLPPSVAWLLRRTGALPVRRRSARSGAGGDIAAQCPYLNPAGEMFAYVRLIGKKCLRPGVSTKKNPAPTKSDQPRSNPANRAILLTPPPSTYGVFGLFAPPTIV